MLIDKFGPVGDQTEVIAKFTVKQFKRTLNLGFHISLLLKLLQVLWRLHCLTVSSVAVMEVHVRISEDSMCLQMLAALPMLTQCEDPGTDSPPRRPLLAVSHCKVE